VALTTDECQYIVGPGTLSRRVPSVRPWGGLELVLLDLLAEGVAVDPQVFGGSREVAPVLLEDVRDELLLELALGVGETYSFFDHLGDE
jgi:hypothetical protein